MNAEQVNELRQHFLVLFQEKLTTELTEKIAAGFEKQTRLAEADGVDPDDFWINFKFRMQQRGQVLVFAPVISWRVAEAFKNDATWSMTLDDKQQMLPGMETANAIPDKLWHPQDLSCESLQGGRWANLLAASDRLMKPVIFTCPEAGAGMVHKYENKKWTSFHCDDADDIIALGAKYDAIALRYKQGDLELCSHAIDIFIGYGNGRYTFIKASDADQESKIGHGGIALDGYLKD